MLFNKPQIMGILNCTPDSFSDGGLFLNLDHSIVQARKLIKDGAHMIDIGGESSRPGADPVSLEEEIRRVVPVVKGIRSFSDIPLSIDTTKPEVARLAMEAGANMINDITGFRNPDMIEVALDFKAKVVVMHMQKKPFLMQKNPQYGDVVEEVKTFLSSRISALRASGIEDIIIDPGIGFGKSFDHNWALLRRLKVFKDLGCPVLLGLSRKSFLEEVSGFSTPEDRDLATLGLHLMTYRYANIWRVHNVETCTDFLSRSK